MHEMQKKQPIPIDMVINDNKIDIEIDIPKIISGKHDVDEILISNIYSNFNHKQIADCMNNIDKNSNLIVEIYRFIKNILISPIVFKTLNDIQISSSTTKWIPYSRITNLEKIAEGGFSIIYKATMHIDRTVAVKKISNSRDISKHFLNEVIIIFLIV